MYKILHKIDNKYHIYCNPPIIFGLGIRLAKREIIRNKQCVGSSEILYIFNNCNKSIL